MPTISLAQLPRFDSPLPSPSQEKQPGTVLPPTVQTPPTKRPEPISPKPQPSTIPPSNAVPTPSPQPSISPKPQPSTVPPLNTIPTPSPQPSISPPQQSATILPSNTIPTQPNPSSETPFFDGSTAPLPNQRQLSLGFIKPVNGYVNIKLTNRTAAIISYQVIGDTTQRKLSGKSEVILRQLKVPVNIIFYRDEGGFLLIEPLFINEQDILELIMTETNDFNLDKSTLLIEETGDLFLN
ncbi:hypothetical protein [Okeania sp.]|uniref:hypothetical protein n=1 Tax=Okeania sp. TaxID=3100323 RepID=UPI002B4B4ADC|nr:hypothetical protein [Okeania sp.]